MNQPTVRVRSTPGSTCSSRPWPSSSTTVGAATGWPRSRRHAATAMASPASSTSVTPAWKAAGTVVSSGVVNSAGRVAETWPMVATVSTTGSRSRCPSAAPPSPSIPVQVSSSARRAAVSACSRSRRAQVRKDVPTRGSAAGRPAAHAVHAAARSARRIRQDTPSTTRWCATSSSRPSSAPRSNHTQRTSSPSCGASASNAARLPAARAAGSSASARPVRSTRVNTDPAGTAPGGRTRSAHPPAPSPTTVARSRSWWSSSAWSAAVSTGTSVGGTRSSTDWPNRSGTGPSSARRHSTGVAATSPTPASAGSASAGSVRSSASSANRATVLPSNTWRGEMRRPSALARLVSWMEMMLSPPSSKKLSSAPTSGRPRISANSLASRCSRGPAGGREPAGRARSGAGSAARSTLPVVVVGSRSSTTNAAGTM